MLFNQRLQAAWLRGTGAFTKLLKIGSAVMCRSFGCGLPVHLLRPPVGPACLMPFTFASAYVCIMHSKYVEPVTVF